MAQVSLIATDLDGTLLRNDGTISARTRTAIRAAQRAGMTVAFVTGRPPRAVRHLVQEAGVSATAVCANGAIIYDAAEDRFLRHEKLPVELARELASVLRARHPQVAFATEHGHRLGYEPGFPQIAEDLANDPDPRVDHVLSLCREAELTKLLIHHPDHGADSLIELARAAVGGRAEVIHAGIGHFVEVAALGVSKESGLKHLCSELAVAPEAVLAFGDMPNDLPMLRFAGRAIAVANAHRAVLEAAHEVTASNEDDGVARSIEALLG
jgi:Cof subfamily protein (haloacid dehalogenase superfamily)